MPNTPPANPSINLTKLPNNDPESIIRQQESSKTSIRVDSGERSVPGAQQMRRTDVFRRHLADLGSNFGAHWISKGSNNRTFLYKISIKSSEKVSRKVSWKNRFWGWIWDAKMGGLEKKKQAFRIIRVAEQQFSMSNENMKGNYIMKY